MSESITTNYAEKLKEKEGEIKALEKIEETKIIESHIDEISLSVQKSVFRDSKPLFGDAIKPRSIRCFCGDSYACDQSKLSQCTK